MCICVVFAVTRKMEEENYRHLKKLHSKAFQKLCKLSMQLHDVAKASQIPFDQSKVADFTTQHLALRLEACAAELVSRPPHFLPHNQKLLLNLSVKRLEEQVKGSTELLERIKSEKAKLIESKTKLLSQLEEETAVFEMVKANYRELDNNESISSQSTSAEPKTKVVDVAIRYRKMKALKAKRLNQMSDFLDEHFPLPDDISITDDNLEAAENPPSQTLAYLIQTLVTTHMRNPNEWITIDDSMCPTYIALLLLTTIAVRNPNNPSQIRLEKFVD